MGFLRGAIVGGESLDVARKLPLQQAPTGYAQDLQRTALQRQVMALQYGGQPGRGLIGQLAHAGAGQQAGFSVRTPPGRCVYRVKVAWQGQQAGQLHAQGLQAVVARCQQVDAGVFSGVEPQAIAHGNGMLREQLRNQGKPCCGIGLMRF